MKWEDCTDVLPNGERLGKGLKQKIQLANLRVPFNGHTRDPCKREQDHSLVAPDASEKSVMPPLLST